MEFAAIGDVPYSEDQGKELKKQMENLDSSAEFVIHVGDIRSAAGSSDCKLQEYLYAANILLHSPVPVFIVLGDNDWLDCPNFDEGLNAWHMVFHQFENYWEHNFNVIRPSDHPNNFAFEYQTVLFLGLNIPGGNEDDNEDFEWEELLLEDFAFAEALIQSYAERMNDKTGRIVVFSHARPRSSHDIFFDNMADLIENIPVLFVNGDGHFWEYERSFHGQNSFLRIQVRGEAKESPTMIRVIANGEMESLYNAFQYHRGEGDYTLN